MTEFPAWASSNSEQSLPVCELTDLPRLMCSCAEHNGWAFDFDDLEPSEHAMFAADPKQPGPARKTKTVTLPEYKAEPWCEARNVPLVTTGSTCEVCGRHPAGDAFVCPECLDDLRVHLGDVPGLLDDLDVMGNRQSRVRSRTREAKPSEHTRWDDLLSTDDSGVTPGRLLASKGYNKPLHVERAVRIRDEIGNEITTAVRAITDQRGFTVSSMTVRAASRWLMVNLSSVSMDPAGPDICNGLRKTTRLAKDIIDNVDEGIYIGICDDEQCRDRMFADPELPEHKCRTCGAVYDVAARLEAIRDKVRESLMSVPELVGRSKSDPATFGKKLHETQVRRWISQGRLVKVGTKPDATGGEVALYRASDVVEIVRGVAAA